MGTYCYTRRKDVKQVGDMEITRFQFAYKCGWRAEENPVIDRLFAAADRAVAANPDIKHCVVAKSFNQAELEPMAIYEIPQGCNGFLEEPRVYNEETGKHEVKVVAFLYKVGRGKFKILTLEEGDKILEARRQASFIPFGQ